MSLSNQLSSHNLLGNIHLNQNYLETFAALPALGAREAYTLARNGFEASFAPDADKARWIAELDAFFEGFA